MASSLLPRGRGEPYFEVVVRALSPLIGPNMARAAARGQCEKLGLPVEHLTRTQAEQLVLALAPGLRVFVGREQTDAALEMIRAVLRDSVEEEP